ncbi:nuclease-related domain-containing DEAD/DEAH box helicase [Natronorubrum thiooxidans]|uniref:Superfamily I DNA and RNA helicases n=1 Tax=Natronorubrum thiooxidans TaxID=308853 RepID=A0A1N7H2Y9_9EURY|nr:nuclease-related domain-containing DEAD/DEAH box helicase [Natronorubrum thiooxidans]SIS19205.1 Superfamily I DNA and RNA helicases [Natronorubrum thiooxidans]
MDFIPTEVDTGQAGSEAELPVWEAIKNAFGADDLGIAYYKYPVIDKSGDDYDREPDFVLLHQELGLIVIECKGYEIDHIESIQGQVWNLQGIRQSKAKPHPQARDQAFKIRSYFTRESDLTDEVGRCKIPVNVFIALPNISREEWEERGFHELPAAPRVLTSDDLSPQALRSQLNETPRMEALSSNEFRAARSVLGGGSVIGNDGTAAPPDPTTKGGLYDTVEQRLPKLDNKQEEIGVQIPPGPQRIRGIAGSGKTVLMAMKAARMHAKHPEWDIAVTFMTKSLYPQVRNLISRFHWHFAEEEPNWNKLRLLHGWGGHTVLDGMYYVLSQQSEEHEFMNVGDARARFGRFEKTPELLDSCCESFLEDGDVPVTFDAILIDEAQDFLPSFFKMCRAALREPKRLVWAYDEAQSLGSLTAPRSKNIFGTDADGNLRVDLSGSYEGGIQKSQIMRKAYRSPRQVLMAAHYFGMGLKRSEGAVQAITTQPGWENLGYKIVDGDFRRTGEDIRIRRPKQNSPHPLSEHDEARPFVRFSAAETKREEIELIGESISRDINDHGLAPEQIMVILLDRQTQKEADEPTDHLDEVTDDGIGFNRVWEGESSVFAVDDEVTVTRINRAKGNEAAMVYISGLEHIDDVSSGQSLVQRRNQAFVAMTRTRGWCHVTGTGSCDAFSEIRAVVDDVTADEPEMVFPAPDPQSLENEMEAELESMTLDEFVPKAE